MKTKILSIFALLLTVTQGAWAQTTADIGRVIAADGKMYKTVTLANKVSTASGVVAYVGASEADLETGHKYLAISLADIGQGAYGGEGNAFESTSSDLATVLTWINGRYVTIHGHEKQDGANHPALDLAYNYSTTRPSGASIWFVASVGQWNMVVKGLTGSNTNLSQDANSALAYDKVNVKIEAAGATGLIESGSNYVLANAYSNDRVWEYMEEGYVTNYLKSADWYTVRPIFSFLSATNGYVVEYNANGGSGAPAAQSKTHGTALTLSSTEPTRDGYTFAGWATSAEGAVAYSAGGSYTTDNDIVLYAKWAPTTISSVADWDKFCEAVNSGYNYSGKTVELAANISVTTMVGTNTRPFAGTFDGQGYTQTVDYNTASSESECCAPFAVLEGTVKKLKVAGSITTSGHRPASIAGFVSGGTITNCISSVNINATATGWIVGGGLVGRVNNEGLDMTGCAFTGSIDFSGSYGGGLVGYVSNSVTLTNCVFAPSAVTLDLASPSFMMFSRGDEGTLGTQNITNCFYNDVAAAQTKITEQNGGKQMRSISAGTDVTSLAISGDATATYNVSGITVYSTGIKYNDVYYACNGESVSLTLSHGDKAGFAFNQYAVTGGGTLTAQTETSATLSMTDANQTINATWTPTYTATFADGNDNTGWTIDPASGVEGTTVTVTYAGENKVKSVTVQAAE